MSRVAQPNAIWPDENYLVCFENKIGDEVILQSEKSADRADYSVEVLNEHERNNARRESYYWRVRKPGEVPNGRQADAFHLP